MIDQASNNEPAKQDAKDNEYASKTQVREASHQDSLLQLLRLDSHLLFPHGTRIVLIAQWSDVQIGIAVVVDSLGVLDVYEQEESVEVMPHRHERGASILEAVMTSSCLFSDPARRGYLSGGC